MTDIPAILTRNGTIFTEDAINAAFREALERVTVLRLSIPEDQRDRLHGLEISLEATKRFYEIAEAVTRTRTSLLKLEEKVRNGSLSQRDANLQAADLESGFVKLVTTIVRLTPGEDQSLIKHR